MLLGVTDLSASAEGFTLIEVLVSLLLFTVGLLGYASLELTVQRFHWEIHQRTYAVNLASYMANQVRSNPIAQGCYNLGSVEAGSAQETPFQCVGLGTLETRALAQADVNQWSALLRGEGQMVDKLNSGGLTNARGRITFDASNNGYLVTVVWQGLTASVATLGRCGDGFYGEGDNRWRRSTQYWVSVASLDG